MNLQDVVTDVPHAPRIIIHGLPGIGKTTFACGAPSPIVIDLEQGIPHNINAPRLMCKTYTDVVDTLIELSSTNHAYKTVVIDSIDSLEDIITKAVVKMNGWANISIPQFGKGYAARTELWEQIWTLLDVCQYDKHMTVIMIAHSHIVKMEDPLLPTYDRHSIDVYKTELKHIIKYADVIGYCHLRMTPTTKDARTRIISDGERILHTHINASYVAKTRYPGMPNEMPLIWSTFEKYLTTTESNSESNSKSKTEVKNVTRTV